MDRAIGAGADLKPTGASRFQPLGTVMPGQSQDTDTGAVSLLGVRSTFQDQRRQLGSARADCRRIDADALDRPRGIAPVRARHVLGDCRVPPAAGAAHVHRYPLAFAEQLDRALGDARIELLSDQPVRYRVVGSGDRLPIAEIFPIR